MGTFLGHVLPGMVLTLIGLWHTLNTIKSYYLKGPSKFVIRFWYPFNNFPLQLKELELILILTFSLLAITLQVLDFPFLHLTFNLINFEHATMFLHLAIFAGFALFAELAQLTEPVSVLVGTMAASVFGQELFLLHFHSADHVDLEGQYHWLLQLIVLISLLATITATVMPKSFAAALVLSISVVFQGCWFINMGFMLWAPKFVPQGCSMQPVTVSSTLIEHGAISCKSIEADFRARALANLQFSWILAGILMLTGLICLILARKVDPRAQRLTAYEQLQIRASDSPASIDSFKQPIDL